MSPHKTILKLGIIKQLMNKKINDMPLINIPIIEKKFLKHLYELIKYCIQITHNKLFGNYNKKMKINARKNKNL